MLSAKQIQQSIPPTAFTSLEDDITKLFDRAVSDLRDQASFDVEAAIKESARNVFAGEMTKVIERTVEKTTQEYGVGPY